MTHAAPRDRSGIAILALSVDSDSAKVGCYAAVPDGDTKTLAADAWLQPVLKELGGRGGGKPNAAQGSGSMVDRVPQAVEKAKSIAAEAFA